MKREYSEIVAPLLKWYAQNARALPWREEPTPYRVWVSEIMLQQTRVEAVKPYFERLVRELPDLRALAEAPEEKLLKLWQGLGYYSRVRNLQKAAKAVVGQFGGELPDSPEQLRRLPGIGDYTAGAIASIAFGKPEPAVDGNVLRVFARLSASGRDIRDPGVKKEVSGLLRGIYPPGRASEFTQSLMELGATVCLPNGEPLCGSCPLALFCEGRKTGKAASLPVRSAPAARKKEQKTVFLIRCGERVALRKRPGKGLLADLWEFPNTPGKLDGEQAGRTLREWGVSPESLSRTADSRHVFSHVEWSMAGYRVRARDEAGAFCWVTAAQLEKEYAVPSAFRFFLLLLRGDAENDKPERRRG